MNQLYDQLCTILDKDQVLLNEPMKKHTTFRIGGPAAIYVKPDNPEVLTKVIRICRQRMIPYFILGNGSNLLVSDDGYHGVVIALQEGWNACRLEADQIIASAGTMLSKIAKTAQRESLTGFEFAAGIPGTLGGALVMNAGAYGSELKDILCWAKVLTVEGKIKKLTLEELQLSYRSSCILSCEYIVLEACLQLAKGDADQIDRKMSELMLMRKTKQPLEYPSAGSTFKRPKGYFAAKLIDDAGLRGLQVGGAQVSDKHCGFVINQHEASASDVIQLCNEVAKRVKNQFNVELELEIRLLGKMSGSSSSHLNSIENT